MRDCEFFESRFLKWKQGLLSGDEASVMSDHATTCIHCGAFSEANARFRDLVIDLPRFRPTNGFELRLDEQIAAVQVGAPNSNRARSRSPYPKMAALGVGLATGLAVGIFVLSSPIQETTRGPFVESSNQAPPIQLAAVPEQPKLPADTLMARKDSSVQAPSHYDAGKHQRMVSGR